ncbi:hypothetical protein D1007_58450 [Hordeum vulgare]|nr:hypothetical protein D1007_58450 [Hordeum vulgare]
MGSLLPKLGLLLMDEYNLHKRVKKDVEFLQKELESMHAALIKVGDVPRDQLDRQVKLWADEVRELSYDMEDVVDKFLVCVEGIQQPHDNSGRFKELKNKMIGLFKKGKNHHRIADAVKEIKEQLQEVAARRDRNKVVVPNPTEPIAIDPCLRSLYAEATELVGIYGKRDQEIMRLLSIEGDDASDKRLKKVSVVGFGGLGKTTLVRAVYDKIKGHFNCRAFVSIGQNPDMKKVLRDILIDLGNPHSDLATLDANQLIRKLHEFLENKRYLVIIDDIWDEKLWEGINFAFPNRNNLGSRLITTTRIVSVSNSCCSSNDDSVYQMEPLSIDDSKRLFCKRIFTDENGCPNEFEQVSKDILKKCGGVPLAIITIASALAGGQKMKLKCEWDILLQSLGSGLTEDNSLEEMRRILSISYSNLPSHLKTCLLYLCIYPEDSTIYRDKLIWKWVAEGFVHYQNQGTSMFLLGLNYFNQLINRSMIQPIYGIGGNVYACRVHDMVLDLICNLSHEGKFVNLLDGTGNINCRRLSLQKRNEDHQAKPLTNIKSTQINKLPAEIGKLQFLEVLDLGNNLDLNELPSTVCNFRRLIYLNLVGCEVVPPVGVLQNLTAIEVLRGILVSPNIIAQELGKSKSMRELEIRFNDGSLDLETSSFELMDLLGERWIPPVHLREFKSFMPSQLSALRGWIQRDPSHLSNLSELTLWPVKEVQQDDVILFEAGALPRAEPVAFSLGMRVAKEDGNRGFDLVLQGNLLSLWRLLGSGDYAILQASAYES